MSPLPRLRALPPAAPHKIQDADRHLIALLPQPAAVKQRFVAPRSRLGVRIRNRAISLRVPLVIAVLNRGKKKDAPRLWRAKY